MRYCSTNDEGIVRYFIGAQVDITGLILDSISVESFRSLLQKDGLPDLSQFPLPNQNAPLPSPITLSAATTTPKQRRVKETLNKLCELSLIFSTDESEIVTRHSQSNSNTYNYSGRDDANDATDTSSIRSTATATVSKSRVAKRVIHADEVDGDLRVSNLQLGDRMGVGNLPGAYKHYLLVRPYPSLQILFVSPSLRLPGLLRTHLFTKLGGSPSTLTALEAAFRDGASVTAKI